MNKPQAANLPDFSLASVPAFWPMAMAAALMKEGAALFKENRLAKGQFVGLGRRLDLRHITCPAYLPAGAEDDITTPEQVLNAAGYLGTPPEHIVSETVPGGHIGLFMGARTLGEHWPSIARWIVAQSAGHA